jgi:Domain of unknown function (DUF4412)
MRCFLSAFIVVVGMAAPAFAGTVITSEMTMPQAAGDKSVVYFEPDRVRVESPGSITIYRADRNTAYMINPAEKKFMRMTPETMKKMAAQMEAMRAQLAEQMKSMPPEQRAQVEKMMAGPMPGPAAKVEFRKVGGAATFGKWRCDKVEQVVNGTVQARLCVAKLSDLGLGDADLGVLQRFAALMQQAAPHSAGAMMDPKALEKIVGYPAFAIHMEMPAAKVTSTTQAVEQKALPASLFEVPAGYQEQAMPGPGH